MHSQSKLMMSALATACALAIAAVAAAATPGTLATAEHIQVSMEHAPVSVSWALPANKPINATPTPYRRVSRQFLINASGAELQRGVALPLTATGDIVRISPLDKDSAAIDAAHVQLVSGGRTLAAPQASKVLATGVQMQQVGMPIQSGSTVFKLGDAVKAGAARVMAAGAKGNYLIQVYEPKSPFAMTLAADHGTRLAGQPVRFTVALAKPATQAVGTAALPKGSLDRVTGVISAPDGWSENARFTRTPDGNFVANVTLPTAHAGERGLWEIHAFARGHGGGQTILREATNAFAVVLPTARLDHAAVRVAPGAGHSVNVDVGVDVGAASRYVVSGVLYGHAKDGQLEPAAYAQSAAWLQPGHDVPIRLAFSPTALAKSGLAGPYQLRDLSLGDQMQLGVLDHCAVAAEGLTASR